MAPDSGGPSRGAAAVGIGILLSRLSGLARERAIGHFLGSGLAVEAFRAALRIPNLLQNLLGEGVLSASFIPVHARLRAAGRERDAGRLAGAVAGSLALLAAAATVAGVVFARPIATVVAVGWSGEKLELTVTLVRIITPGVGLLVLSAWALGVLNSHRRFFLSYVAPVLWNASMIAALVGGALAAWSGAELGVALAWGMLAGSALQLLVQLPAVVRLSPGLRPSLRWRVPETAEVFRNAVPVITGRGVAQLLGYLTLVLASLLAAGAVAALTYAQVLYLLPISLFGMSVAAAELPELSSLGDDGAAVARKRLADGMDRISFFVVPTVATFVVLGDEVVSLLYRSGRFDRLDAVQVWLVLAAFSLGLVATTRARLLQSVLYAAGDTRTPARLSVLRVAVAAFVGGALMLQFDAFEVTASGIEQLKALPVLDLPAPALRNAPDNARRLGAVGLGVGAGLSGWLEYLLLRRAVAAHVGTLNPSRRSALRHWTAAAAAVGAVLLAQRAGCFSGALAVLAPLVAAGILYLLVVLAAGDPTARGLAAALLQRCRRRPR